MDAYQSGRTWLIKSSSVEKLMLVNSLSDAQNSYSMLASDPKNKSKALSFFSGAMGLDLGIEQVGFETLLASEIDKAARDTILSNSPNMALIGDIRDYTTEDILKLAGVSSGNEIDLIMGGPTCQAFSTAGKRLGLE
ncbi:DNA cytosine methyltransferase, partial [Salmonella enterica]|uniref:DNA cytosine methyltransferase n=1 Tax=Salmonella enterica TaxID=28901 RepID=UPI001EE902E8